MQSTDPVISMLLASPEPSIRFLTRRDVLGEDPASPDIQGLQQEICTSPRVTALLSERSPDGTLPLRPYFKWRGAHWVLVALADLGYPPGDSLLQPLAEQELSWLLGKQHVGTYLWVDGRIRRCASQEANALYALLALGLADERCDELARRLASWQWPDGGWNCDKRPQAHHSSFMESLIPLRALAWHARLRGDPVSQQAAERAAEFFLRHGLYRREADGSPISPDFLSLHYPCYWHYDILFGLKVMAEAGHLGDPRCADALDCLLSKRLPGGGFPSEGKYYRLSTGRTSGASLVDWGPSGKTRPNEWVTLDACRVLAASGRRAEIDHE